MLCSIYTFHTFGTTFSPASAVLLLLLLTSALAPAVSASCRCTAPFSDGRINCSSQGLRRIPDFPVQTTELHLQNNRLSTVPPGHLDTLQSLRLLDLSANPFHCGCNIQYLRLWLRRNGAAVRAQPTCASPAALARRTVASLSEAELSGCVRNPCPGTGYNLAAGFMLSVLVALLVWCLRLAKGLSFTLGIGEKHAGFEAESLRSLKPKHRARVRGMGHANGELERPLLDMDILPQIIDTLHRQHNIKIKEM
ncbi:glycoprotein IX (platelet) [Trichomycterus rosablanca]|uniref:glycoprotein IX (platelet) n=1 Tax=Trichomycterus rosablanca TaxID=2290929 RepID=UPI002F352FAD